MDTLDKNWKNYAKQINQIIIEAANKISEIAEIKKKAGINGKLVLGVNEYEEDENGEDEVFYELQDQLSIVDFSPIIDELENIGWQHSSYLC